MYTSSTPVLTHRGHFAFEVLSGSATAAAQDPLSHNDFVWAFILAWVLPTLTAALASAMLTQQIIDEIERNLPIEERPSWKLWRLKRGLPLKELRLHSQMYPNSRIRTSWKVATVFYYALIVFGILWLLIWNLRR
jgi:hypothetical protein